MDVIVYDETSIINKITAAVIKLAYPDATILTGDEAGIKLPDLAKDNKVVVYLSHDLGNTDLELDNVSFINTYKWPENYNEVECAWRFLFGNDVPKIIEQVNQPAILEYLTAEVDSKLNLPKWTTVTNPYRFDYTKFNELITYYVPPIVEEVVATIEEGIPTPIVEETKVIEPTTEPVQETVVETPIDQPINDTPSDSTITVGI